MYIHGGITASTHYECDYDHRPSPKKHQFKALMEPL